MEKVLALFAALALLVVFPTTALAAPPKPFTATGVVTGIESGVVQLLPVGFITRGEPVSILIASSPDWTDLQWASVTTVHRSTSLVIDPGTGAISGVGDGAITVQTTGGLVLTGRFTFSISGHVDVSTGTISDLQDQGVFTVGGGGVRANGTFTLVVNPTTNNVVFSGGYTTNS